MQELTREVTVAYNVCEHNNNNKIEYTTSEAVPKSNSYKLETLTASLLVPVKLENVQSPELIPVWQSTGEREHLRGSSNTTKLLLQSSDDPLISHGANNDGHDEDHPFKTLLARKTQDQRSLKNGGCSTLTRQQLKVKANLMSARKVYRREQACSQSLIDQATSISRQTKSRGHQGTAYVQKLRFHHQALPAEYAAHYEATQGRHVSKAKSTQVAVAASNVAPPTKQVHENVRSWLRKIAEIQLSAERQQQTHDAGAPFSRLSSSVVVAPTSMEQAGKRKLLKYADLPYMGEITLDNYKPRRGRKPKKADICHLIYKNYGTIVPSAVAPTVSAGLMQRVVHKKAPVVRDEPLNLCLRDQSSDRYSISSGDSHSESDKPSTMTIATKTTDCGSCSNRTTPLMEGNNVATLSKPLTPDLVEGQHANTSNFLLQPMGVYYQKLMESCAFGDSVETIEKDNQLALKIPIPNGFFSSAANRESITHPSNATSTPLAIRKRKRSAIFIPPKASEHSSCPSTEVSICKFKFTGGAKPMLQEKKMLSVDAEGNYRYYNGIGERDMRGHECTHQELQQQSLPKNQQMLNGTIDKLYIDVPPPSTDLCLEFLHMPPESPTSSLLMSTNLVSSDPQNLVSQYSSSQTTTPMHAEPSNSDYADLLTDNVRKRRCSRRSKQREKMEKSFKEKGFLIQTQQLESAEGATYCKFRQLKKFTRYLFRNWKDHIPESDLVNHQGNSGCDQHTIFENLLSGQIDLDNVTSAKTADQSHV